MDRFLRVASKPSGGGRRRYATHDVQLAFVDAFILKKLADQGLEPSPEAPKEKLLRRVTLDLTGLPPTLPELDAFLADASPDAYEKAVDRLLASLRYGERMVWEWLDAARYADTNGYQGDPTRAMCSAIFVPCVTTSSRRSVHAWAIPVRTCRNDGSPCCGTGGKYVPAK